MPSPGMSGMPYPQKLAWSAHPPPSSTVRTPSNILGSLNRSGRQAVEVPPEVDNEERWKVIKDSQRGSSMAEIMAADGPVLTACRRVAPPQIQTLSRGDRAGGSCSRSSYGGSMAQGLPTRTVRGRPGRLSDEEITVIGEDTKRSLQPWQLGLVGRQQQWQPALAGRWPRVAVSPPTH